ncbi:MAG: glutaredoxin family protein [Acidobacteriota bacterium]
MITLTLYTRPGCHLCDDMKAVVRRTLRDLDASHPPGPSATVEEIDISTDPSLEARYGLEIPVLLVNGSKAAKYRVTTEELRRTLAGRAGDG